MVKGERCGEGREERVWGQKRGCGVKGDIGFDFVVIHSMPF